MRWAKWIVLALAVAALVVVALYIWADTSGFFTDH
jgi:hypothetical protein